MKEEFPDWFGSQQASTVMTLLCDPRQIVNQSSFTAYSYGFKQSSTKSIENLQNQSDILMVPDNRIHQFFWTEKTSIGNLQNQYAYFLKAFTWTRVEVSGPDWSDTNKEFSIEIIDLLYEGFDMLYFSKLFDVDDGESVHAVLADDFAKILLLYTNIFQVNYCCMVASLSFLDDITSIDAALNNCINRVPDTNLAAMAKMMKCNMATVVASVLDPRNKIEYVEVLLGDVYGKIERKAMCAMIKASLVELYKDYVRIHASPETHTMFESGDASSSTNKRSATATLVIESSVILKQKVRMEMKRIKSESGLQESKTELDRYLNEDVEDESDKFDILNWWKVNSPRFPVLSLLARDVLAIPISTGVSESVFSTGGRVLDAFRSSLNPPVVESLICTQDWFHENSMMLDVAENWDEIQKIEEGIYIYIY
nr:hypothetical protein [Tanacetum cinerariifolium]